MTRRPGPCRPVWVLALGVMLWSGSDRAYAQAGATSGEWRSYGGDRGNTKYSPLDQINADNAGGLRVLWRRPVVAEQLTDAFPDLNPASSSSATPLVVDGVLYVSNGVGLVEALDPRSGETLWIQEPLEEGFRGVAGGSATRGIAWWEEGPERRIVSIRGERLLAVSPETGGRYRDFGDDGSVNLRRDDPRAFPFVSSSGPAIAGDVIVVGGDQLIRGEFGTVQQGAPQDIRGYDVRTGRLRWTFHVMPRPGELGADTWGNGSGAVVGGMGGWAPISVDEELGYIYVPLASPTNSWYGGHRPGRNLFANSLVCLDAATGERVWHYQVVHHDVWDYDLPAAPVLGDITVDGRRIKAVMQVTKHGFLFAFDRVTGEPVWPIEERPVPGSTAPGERTWPTQPFPTRPAPFDRQGVTVDDLIDFTPELRAAAEEIARSYLLGPLFTPPSVPADGLRGTLTLPGGTGGANVGGGAFDPATGIFYVTSNTSPWVNDLITPPEGTLRYVRGPEAGFSGACCEQYAPTGPDGLPLIKPPYSRITAIDMNSGEHAWMAPNGNGPRDHPRLGHLNLPPLGEPSTLSAPSLLLTATLLFAGENSNPFNPGAGRMFRAWDKASGEVVWETELAGGVSSAPMTYMAGGRQYVLLTVAGAGQSAAEWVALGLP